MEVEEQPRPQHVHPECEVGKHGNCGGVTMDDDDWVDCDCPCHREHS